MNYCKSCFRNAKCYGEFFPIDDKGIIYELIFCDGHYSIVEGHNEIVRFPNKPLEDPTWNIESDMLIDELYKDPEFCKKDEEYYTAVNVFSKEFMFHPQIGYELCNDAKRAGWIPEKHGWLEYWIFNRAAQLIREKHDTLSRTA